MAYRKRDYLYPKSSTYMVTVLMKNQPPVLLDADSKPAAPARQMSSELMDVLCETFYAMLDFADSQGLPVLQLCRVPNFIDFLKNNKIIDGDYGF